MAHVYAGPRPQAGIHHEGVDVAFTQRPGGEVGKRGELAPKGLTGLFARFHAGKLPRAPTVPAS